MGVDIAVFKQDGASLTKLYCIMKIKLLIGLFVLVFLAGCETFQPFVDGPDGSVVVDPVVVERVDALGDTVGALGVPYAGLSGELFLALAGSTALVLTERQRRKEKKVNATLIKSIEKSKNSKESVVEIVKQVAEKDGTQSDLKKRVDILT